MSLQSCWQRPKFPYSFVTRLHHSAYISILWADIPPTIDTNDGMPFKNSYHRAIVAKYFYACWFSFLQIILSFFGRTSNSPHRLAYCQYHFRDITNRSVLLLYRKNIRRITKYGLIFCAFILCGSPLMSSYSNSHLGEISNQGKTDDHTMHRRLSPRFVVPLKSAVRKNNLAYPFDSIQLHKHQPVRLG